MNPTLLIKCSSCRKIIETPITVGDYGNVMDAPRDIHIQDIIPHVPAQWREMLISGVCPKCWDRLFTEQFNEEEYY